MTSEAAEWSLLRDRWRRFEAAAVDNLWVGDHLWSSVDAGGLPVRPRYDTMVMLAILAASTKRVRIGTLVASTAYRTAAVMAKAAISVDLLAPGRLDLGLGAGANPRDAAAAGLPVLPAADRVAAFGAAVAVVAALVRRTVVDHAGPNLRFESVVSLPRPSSEFGPSILVAAHRDESLRVAAALGDGWVSYAGGASIGRTSAAVPSAEAMRLTRERLGRLSALADAAGRDPRSLRKLLLVGFTDDPWSQSVDACADMLGRYREIGIDEFAFPYPAAGIDEETFTRRITDARASIAR